MSSEKEKPKKQQIYIGKLPFKINEHELEKEFDKFGSHEPILLKRNFAFIVVIILILDLR